MNLLELALSSIEFLTFREKTLLGEKLSSVDDLCSMDRETLGATVGRAIKNAAWDGKRCLAASERSLAIIERLGIKAYTAGDRGYPAMFSQMFDPPYMVFARGEIGCIEKRCVSIVGTRRVCQKCAESTLNFAGKCASEGLTVVSGLAYGVDTFAHRGALSSGGLTAAVMPCGIDTVVPAGNRTLASRILEGGGLLLSEYLPGVPSETWRYVKRNRLIAALSSVTVVTQAPPGSGALITADFALNYNRYLMFHRDCFCEQASQLTEKTVAELRMKNTKAALGKIENSSENYVRDGAPVFGSYDEFVRALEECPDPSEKKSNQPELAF
ncbi:MAG: DNA-processing protein DprA [Treponema sp.]|nr:DNA-processing protein DprA [Treponema sp.]